MGVLRVCCGCALRVSALRVSALCVGGTWCLIDDDTSSACLLCPYPALDTHARTYVCCQVNVHAKLGRLRDVGGDHVETDVAVGVQLRKRDLRTTRLLLDQAVDKGFQLRAGIQAPVVKHRHHIDIY